MVEYRGLTVLNIVEYTMSYKWWSIQWFTQWTTRSQQFKDIASYKRGFR